MKRFALVLLFAACTAAPPPAPTPAPPPPAPVAAPQSAAETPIGSGRVNASTLNVRSEPSLQGDVIGHARRGERVTILGESGEWIRVRTGGGEVGWVSSQHVARDDAATSSASRGRRGCPPDSDYRFLTPPRPSFNENGPHGVVAIEASVNAEGVVLSTRVVSNTTGQEAFAAIAAREVKEAKFAPPVRSCVARAFLFTYRRAF